MTEPSTCPRCGRAVFWAFTARGTKLKLDVQPDPDGAIAVAVENGGSVAYVHRVEWPAHAQRFTSHLRTCRREAT
jgi:hypothetical protein